MKEKEKDLIGKNEEEIINTYDEIAKEIEAQKIIWNNVDDYEGAKKIYTKYLESKRKN